MSSQPIRLTLGLMMKYWDVGQVKTRLGATIGMHRAAALHRLFVSHLCRTLADVADWNIVSLAPDLRLGRFRSDLRSWGLDDRWNMLPQGDGDLGQRMQRWFVHCLGGARPGSGPRSVRAILIGADCPQLESDHIRQADRLLQRHDAVVGPAADGGYYLLGLRGPWESHAASFESLFHDVPWSTEDVLRITQDRLARARLSVALLDRREDIDTNIQLNRLRESLDSGTDGFRGAARLRAGIERILGEDSPPQSWRSSHSRPEQSSG